VKIRKRKEKRVERKRRKEMIKSKKEQFEIFEQINVKNDDNLKYNAQK
jgi:hypothetical protein